MHMAFASSSRHWELPALLLVWKALGLVWKAALRATAEDRVSLSGCGPGKRGGFWSPLVALIKYSPTSPGRMVCYSRNYSALPRQGVGAGWRAQGQNLERGEVGETSGMRKERNCPLLKERFFFPWNFLSLKSMDLWPCWREWYMCSVSDYSCG